MPSGRYSDLNRASNSTVQVAMVVVDIERAALWTRSNAHHYEPLGAQMLV